MLRCQSYTLDQGPSPCLILKHRWQPITTFFFPREVVPSSKIEKFHFGATFGFDRSYPQHRETMDRSSRAPLFAPSESKSDHRNFDTARIARRMIGRSRTRIAAHSWEEPRSKTGIRHIGLITHFDRDRITNADRALATIDQIPLIILTRVTPIAFFHRQRSPSAGRRGASQPFE